ncbi:hypothetical protein FGRMN_6857 [Fusarium graminum]|nr:hypothetical protein FGRMN_6857 [Fusarium graminum]
MSTLVIDADEPVKTPVSNKDQVQATKDYLRDMMRASQGEPVVPQYVWKEGVDAYGRDVKELTPLHQACKLGRADLASAVLQEGVSPNLLDDEGRSPLSHAAEGGNIEIITFLLDNGADVDVADTGGWTPLMVAAEQGHDETVAILLKHGADPNAADEDNFTALIEAVISGSPAVTARLLDAGADPDAQDETDNLTAISRAAERGSTDVVKLLLERGVDPNVDDRTLLSALYGFEDTSEDQAVIKMLVEHGADVFMDGWSDERPLVIAASQGWLITVELFLKATFSSSSVRQEHIGNAVMVAAEHGHAAILEMLMEHYEPNETERQELWEWAKDYEFGDSYELLRPYFEPGVKGPESDIESE